MLTIYIPELSSRCAYVFDHIFGNIAGIDYRIVNDRELFLAADGAKISYTSFAVSDEVFFMQDTLLFTEGISKFQPDVIRFSGHVCLFPLNNERSALPYDPFASAFYMLSRYEEYLPHTTDEHGRFETDQSLAFQSDFLNIPVVEYWIEDIFFAIKKKYQGFCYKIPQYHFLPTFDVDIAYAFHGKGFLRTSAGMIQDLAKFQLSKLSERTKVISGRKVDPYDSYAYIEDTMKSAGLKPVFFIHPGTWGKFDKNISLKGKRIAALLKQISEYADIGLHPSYLSSVNNDLLKNELAILSEACGHNISKARQHFIKIKMPDTYRNYITHGITHDYSMGFASGIGFRAGTSLPFLFYDLLAEKATGLTVQPFSFMEGVFMYYQKIEINDQKKVLSDMISEIKKTGGCFCSLWHNESLGEQGKWKGWRSLYEAMIIMAV